MEEDDLIPLEEDDLIPLLKLKDTFSSYQEFRKAVEKYERVNRVRFYVSDAKRLHRASPTTYEIVKNYPELEYCSLKLSCVYGGKTVVRKKDFTDIKLQHNRGSFRRGCEAGIFINLNDSRNKLIVSRINEKHNHDILSADVLKQLKRVRRGTERSRVTKKNTSVKHFNDRLLKSEGISVENLVKKNSLSRSKNFERVAKILAEKFRCTVDLRSDDEGKIYGLFLQDEYMMKSYHLFPEFLTVDCAYKLRNINCSVYVIWCENSLGSNIAVGVGMVTDPDKESFDWIMERFKERNPETANVSVILTDRQACEFEISQLYPTSEISICASNALYTVRREIGDLKMFRSEAPQCCEFFAKLIGAESRHQFKAILEDMEDSVPHPFTKYYYNKWHPFSQLWARKFSKSRSFSNKLKDPSTPFRAGLSSSKTFAMFAENLFRLLHRQRGELRRDIWKATMKTYSGKDHIEAGRLYDEFLTPHAFDKIQYSLYLAENQASTCHLRTENDDTYYQNEENSFLVSELSCMCDFSTIMRLPCEHILTYRKLHGMDLFAEYLFSERWTRERLKQLLVYEIPTSGETNKKKTSDEKFSEVEPVCWELAALCTRVPTKEFHQRLTLLNQVKASWENKDRVVLQTVEYAQLEVASGSDMEVEDDEEYATEEIILEVTK